jgi:hypothetical protein
MLRHQYGASSGSCRGRFTNCFDQLSAGATLSHRSPAKERQASPFPGALRSDHDLLSQEFPGEDAMNPKVEDNRDSFALGLTLGVFAVGLFQAMCPHFVAYIAAYFYALQ